MKIQVILSILTASLVSAATFTDVNQQGVVYLNRTVANELIESINARLHPDDTNTFALIEVGDVLQDAVLWSNMQSRVIQIESEGTDFGQWVHYTNLTDTASTLVTRYNTNNIPTFYTNAGISNGFRRALELTPTNTWTDYNDAMYSYGFMQPGDIIGPWIIEDLQLALAEIRRFRTSRGGRYEATSWIDGEVWSGSGSGPTFSDAHADAGWGKVKDIPFEGQLFFRESYIQQSTNSTSKSVSLTRFFTKLVLTTPTNSPYNPPYTPIPVGEFVHAETNGGVVHYAFQEGGGFVKPHFNVEFENLGDPIYRGATTNELTLVSSHSFLGSDTNYPISVTFGTNAVISSSYLFPYDEEAGGLQYEGYRAHSTSILEPIMPYTRAP